MYLHDEVSTDRRNPTVNANGPIYGALELSADYVPVLDPMSHSVSQVPMTARDPSTRPASSPVMLEPSPYWGDEVIWTSKNNVHNPMLDGRGRVWLTSTVRPPDNPDFAATVRIILRRSYSRPLVPGAIWRSTLRRRRSSLTSAPASARTTMVSR